MSYLFDLSDQWYHPMPINLTPLHTTLTPLPSMHLVPNYSLFLTPCDQADPRRSLHDPHFQSYTVHSFDVFLLSHDSVGHLFICSRTCLVKSFSYMSRLTLIFKFTINTCNFTSHVYLVGILKVMAFWKGSFHLNV